MSQEQVALKSGISSSYISNLERGKINPTLSLLERHAKGLGVHSADILSLAKIYATRRGEVKC
jgi:transcriptional regulator with XRE-family HTH domain